MEQFLGRAANLNPPREPRFPPAKRSRLGRSDCMDLGVWPQVHNPRSSRPGISRACLDCVAQQTLRNRSTQVSSTSSPVALPPVVGEKISTSCGPWKPAASTMARIRRQVDDPVAHHAAVVQQVPASAPASRRCDARGCRPCRPGAGDLRRRARGPTRRDRRRSPPRSPRRVRRRCRAPARACSRRRGRPRTSDAAARSPSAPRPRGRAAASPRARPHHLAAPRRCPSTRPAARRTTITRQSAPSSAASSTARRLSSIACARSSAVGAGKKPPRQSPVTRTPFARTIRAAAASPIVATWSRHGADRGDAMAQAAVDRLREVPLPANRGEVDRQAVERLPHHATPCTASTRLIRAAAQLRVARAPAPCRPAGTAPRDAAATARSPGRRPSRNDPAAR